MEEIFMLLAAVGPMSDGLINYLSSCLEARELKKKEFVLKPGRVCGNIYFVAKGLFRCFYLKNNQELCAWFMEEGKLIVSVKSFFMQVPSREAIQAIEDSLLYGISFAQLEYASEHFPEFNYIRAKLTEKYYVLSEDRTDMIRSMRAVERYEYLMETQPGIINRVPVKYVATYLGMTEETLSRIRGMVVNK